MSNFLRLGDHCSKIGSGSTPSGGHKSYVANGIPLIRSQNVLMRSFTSEGLARITLNTHGEMAGTEVKPGDVLINITGASIGRVCVVPDEICPANVNQHVCIIRCGPLIDPNFLMLHLSSPSFQKLIDDTQAGGTRQALTKADIERFEVPSLSLDQQKKIAKILNQRLETLRQAQEAARQQLDEMKVLPMKLLTDFLNRASFPMRPLGELCSLLPAKSICLSGDKSVRVITTACLSETKFQLVGIKSGRMWSRDATESTVERGEILMARSNTPELVGRVSIFNGEASEVVASDLTIRILPTEEMHGAFLNRYLSALYTTGYWKERAGGASGSMKKIRRSQVLDLQIPVPPLAEQRKMAAALEHNLTCVSQAHQAAKQQFNELKLLPQKLLAQVFDA